MAGDNYINYYRLIESLEFYQDQGFIYQNVPWAVEEEIVEITKSSEFNNYWLNGKCLVGSAEQSFLSMIRHKNLNPGRYVAITPCFRDEIEDDLHKSYFMKVELIDTKDVTESSLLQIIEICLKFFNQYIDCKSIQLGQYQYDIVDTRNNIEMGSYGIREHEELNWIYATGCAEPRLTYARNKLK